MTGICDKCEQETAIRFIERKRPRGLKETYFRCNECNAHYTCFVTDRRVRRMQKEVERLRGTGQSITALQAEIERRMEKLKKEVERTK